MSVRMGLLWACFCIAAFNVHAQTPPTEYATFLSHGKGISCAVFDTPNATATVIFLRGASPADLVLGRAEARFFADHGFRVLLPDYLSATTSTTPNAANYRRWAEVVDDIVADLRTRTAAQSKKLVLAGQSMGASVALVAGSHRLQVEAIAEWSGQLPNAFFSQVQSLPPLLILHGELDEEVPMVNARQLVRLCQLRDFTCELQIYAGEGHTFSDHITDSSNQRALAFFRAYLHE